MKRRILSLCIALLSASLLSAVAFAHPGQTDADGGHNDRSTGEYHYHHGYPAHQHTDGQCPYDFDDRTGWNSGSSGSSSSSHRSKSSSLSILVVIGSAAAAIAAIAAVVVVCRCKAKVEQARQEKARVLEEAQKLQALRDSLPDFKEKVDSLRREYSDLQAALLKGQVRSPLLSVNVPEDSFLGGDGLPHQFGANTDAEDKFYFAVNESTSVLHRPSCTYAWGLPLRNIMDIYRPAPYSPNPYQRPRPCLRCKPQIPNTAWVRLYKDLQNTLAFFGVTVEDLNYIGKPCNKLNRKKMIVYRYRIHGIALYGVESDVISHIGYSCVGEILLVRMRSTGRVYTYTGISPRVHKQFICAESIGRFYNQYIKRHPGSK